jgi:hypothetical protein
MEALADEAHRSGDERRELVELSRGIALTLLERPEYLGDAGTAAAFLDHVDQRAGLLVGRGGVLDRPPSPTFPHRTFQEYLAGCYTLGRDDAVRQLFAFANAGDHWRLATQLGAEELLLRPRGPQALLDIAYRLCPATEPTSTQDGALPCGPATWRPWRGVRLLSATTPLPGD